MRAMIQEEAEYLEAVCKAHRKVIETMKTDLKELEDQLKAYEEVKQYFGQNNLPENKEQQLERTLKRAMLTTSIGMVIFSEKVKIRR